MSEWSALLNVALGTLTGTVATVWYLSWWLSSKFDSLKNLIYSESEKTRTELTGKLEYHEKHDDSRFSRVDSEIWAIKMRNAARDGLAVPPVYKQVYKDRLNEEENEDHAFSRKIRKTPSR